MARTHGTVEANGIDLHYVREGSGPPLVFLHGWPEYWRTWRHNLPALADQFDVVAPDLRGFGASAKPDVPAMEGYTLADHVADLGGFADALGFDEFGVVSHDVGARVAQAFARERPDRVCGLFFLDCPYAGIGDRWTRPDHAGEIWYQSFHQQPWAADLVGASRETCATYIGHFLEHWSADPSAFSEADREAWIDTYLQPGNLQGGFNWYIAAARRRRRTMEEGPRSLPEIEAPARFRWGEEDPVIRVEWGDRLGEYFADYEFDPLPDAGHFAHYERPEPVNRSIREFFSGSVGN